MKLSSLMEKAQAGPYKLLRLLLDQEGPHTLKSLQEETGLSKSTLIKYQELLQEQLLGLARLSLLEEEVSLELALGVAPEDLVQPFLADSVKYEILMHLLRQQRFSVSHLSSQLLVSEATFNRHLARLNELLSEFEIKISKGTLKGPEHQVRIFYFQLLRMTWTARQLEKHSPLDHYSQELALVQRLVQEDLDVEAKNRLRVWFYVTKKRLTASKETDQLAALMQPYQGNVFYERTRLECLRYLSRYALEVDESEAMQVFAFLNSQFILPLHTMTYILGFGGPIMDRVTQTQQFLRKAGFLGDYTSEHVTYQLGQLFGQAYFYRGKIRWSDGDRKPEMVRSNPDMAACANEIRDRYFPDKLSPAFSQTILWELQHTLYYIREKEQVGVRIALDLEAREILYYRMRHDLETCLENNRLVEIEEYDPTQPYDLIISNQGWSSYGDRAVYFLQNDLNSVDQEAIKKQVAKLLHSE